MTQDMVPGGFEGLAAAIGPSIPMKRLATHEEMADAVVWLCSDHASYITGHTLIADGGFTAF